MSPLDALPSGRPTTNTELNVSSLGSLVADTEEIPADGSEVSESDSELLARLDSAVTVASGVEAKLNEILGTLDDLLTTLDHNQPQGATTLRSEPQTEWPLPEQSS